MDSSPQQPMATWNTARSVWEQMQGSLFCEHLAPFSEIWPRSGSMRNGQVYSRPTLEPRIAERESSSSPGLPTPTARDGKGVPGKNVQMASLPRVISLLPTPNTMDSLPPKTREQIKAHRDAGKGGDRNLREAVLYELEGTWGKYAEAIRTWEEVLGRLVPFPTENTGKDGRARLSPLLSEWMMGLPEGWVTAVPGLSYQQKLKLLGNGVVVQQAELTLRKLLDMQQKHFPT